MYLNGYSIQNTMTHIQYILFWARRFLCYIFLITHNTNMPTLLSTESSMNIDVLDSSSRLKNIEFDKKVWYYEDDYGNKGPVQMIELHLFFIFRTRDVDIKNQFTFTIEHFDRIYYDRWIEFIATLTEPHDTRDSLVSYARRDGSTMKDFINISLDTPPNAAVA